MSNVGIVIVSHSQQVAAGTAEMVLQMVGDEVPLAWCGGNPDGGLGTSVEAIMEAISKAWSDSGVAVMVDLGELKRIARWRLKCYLLNDKRKL